MQRFLFFWLLLLPMLFVRAEPATESAPSPHIALLLPLKSANFRAAASAVQQGFQAAASLNPRSLPVRIYPCNDESRETLDLYTQAYRQGAVLVVGPLTRNGVAVLTQQPMIPLPTLALNTLDSQGSQRLFGFGMDVEGEARLIAQLAMQRGLKEAIVIGSAGPFAMRMQLAFEEAWNEMGGKLQREIAFNNEVSVLSNLAYTPHTFAFLAVTAQQSRLLRPYLPRRMPVYGTSQLYASTAPTNFEFNGFRFVDMPWLIQTDTAPVLDIPRANPPLSLEMERMYALGIDAYRLSQRILDGKLDNRFAMEGVTGHLTLDGQQFLRTAMPATFSQGKAQVWNIELPDIEPASDIPVTQP